MGGPAASVLMPSPYAGLIPQDVLKTLSAISANVKNTNPNECDLQIVDTRSIGGGYRGGGRPFVFRAQRADAELEETRRTKIHTEFGIEPIQEFVIIAMCNGAEDHQILAEMVLYFAKGYGGVIDFGGALLPPQWWTRPGAWTKVSWPAIQPDFDAWIKSFPGKVVGLPYEVTQERWWTTHVGDTIFLEAWMRSPDFRMIK